MYGNIKNKYVKFFGRAKIKVRVTSPSQVTQIVPVEINIKFNRRN